MSEKKTISKLIKSDFVLNAETEWCDFEWWTIFFLLIFNSMLLFVEFFLSVFFALHPLSRLSVCSFFFVWNDDGCEFVVYRPVIISHWFNFNGTSNNNNKRTKSINRFFIWFEQSHAGICQNRKRREKKNNSFPSCRIYCYLLLSCLYSHVYCRLVLHSSLLEYIPIFFLFKVLFFRCVCLYNLLPIYSESNTFFAYISLFLLLKYQTFSVFVVALYIIVCVDCRIGWIWLGFGFIFHQKQKNRNEYTCVSYMVNACECMQCFTPYSRTLQHLLTIYTILFLCLLAFFFWSRRKIELRLVYAFLYMIACVYTGMCCI